MNYTVSKSIQAGQMIKTSAGWRKVKEVIQEGVIVKEGLIKFGSPVLAWKIK